jgi:hypothetical protein
MAGRNRRDSEFDEDDYRTGGVLYRPPLYFILLFVTCAVLIAATVF